MNEWNAALREGPNIIGGPFVGGNYWSDYLGVDTDGDGIGDTDLPYDATGSIHVGGDSLPLVEPQPKLAFIRGDCNNNGVFDGLGDGLEALNYQFVLGFPEPGCLAACDTNHNNVFSGISDALMILDAQFLPGSPVPDPPWPSCGTEAPGAD